MHLNYKLKTNFFLLFFFFIFFTFTSMYFPSHAQSITQPAGVVTEVVKTEGITNAGLVGGLQGKDRLTVHNYVDGLGRPLETILMGASPNGKDLISFFKYDALGRGTQQYLPFEASTINATYPEPEHSFDQSGEFLLIHSQGSHRF
jgi:hypothetical protein